MFHTKTIDAAKGKWRGILMALGVPEKFLVNRHGPCPLCAGEDRFRWDNKMGSGSYICGQCGAGDGMELAKKFTGEDFLIVANKIDAIIGNIKPDADHHVDTGMSDDDRRAMLRAAYADSKQAVKGDLVDRYLTSRGLHNATYPKALRFAPSLKDGGGGLKPCMLAMVVDAEGKPVTMHRTFLAEDGSGKATMPSPRKMMPGALPDGACVRLTDGDIPKHIGIAEGIETAMGATAYFDMPVWACLSTALMKKWTPPEGVEEVTIMADNDLKFGGQAAAYELAHKLAVKGFKVDVQVPPMPGTDWNNYTKRKVA